MGPGGHGQEGWTSEWRLWAWMSDETEERRALGVEMEADGGMKE